MTQAPSSALSGYAAPGSGTEPPQILIQRLAGAGFGVHGTRWQDRHELTILNVTAARSCLTLTDSGCARWHYEPAAGPAAGAVTLAAIIVHILGAPHAGASIPGVAAYRAFPLKGAVGRSLARPGPDRHPARVRRLGIVRGHHRRRSHQPRPALARRGTPR